jgi:adenylosuccinate synthase
MLRENGFTGQIVNLAVHRAYSIRHGAGPLPTADPAMNELLLPGSSKEENRWQGKVRVEPLDFVQMRKALTDSLPIQFDGLALTWFDQINKNGLWHFCDHYQSDGTPVIENVAIPLGLSPEKLFNFAAQQMAKFVNVPVRMVSFGPTETDKVFK